MWTLAGRRPPSNSYSKFSLKPEKNSGSVMERNRVPVTDLMQSHRKQHRDRWQY